MEVTAQYTFPKSDQESSAGQQYTEEYVQAVYHDSCTNFDNHTESTRWDASIDQTANTQSEERSFEPSNAPLSEPS